MTHDEMIWLSPLPTREHFRVYLLPLHDRFEAHFPGWWNLTWKTLVVTRQGAWVRHEIFGITWKMQWLGRRPEVRDFGYDWSEIAVMPKEACVRAALDGEREVLLEWDWQDPSSPKEREARALTAFMRAQVDRLLPAR